MLKKSLLILALTSLVGMISAQTLQLQYNGEVIANNSKIIYDDAPTGWGLMEFEMELTNLTDDFVHVIMEKEHVQIVEGTENYFCWGSCFEPGVMISERPVELAPNTTSGPGMLSVHYNLDPTYSGDPDNYPAGTTIVKYYFYTIENPDDKLCVEVWFAYNATDVAESNISLGQAYPNPATNQVQFDVNTGNSSVTAVVYNLLGQEMKSVVSSRDRISIDVNDMQPGVYFCSFFVNDEVIKTEKFIVKR